MAVAAVGVAVSYSRSVSSFLAGALSRYLERHVEIAEIDVKMGQAFVIELRGLVVYEGLEATGEPVIEVPYARGAQSWPRLLVGQLIPAKWEFEEPVLRAQIGGDDDGGGLVLELPYLPPMDVVARKATLVITRPEGERIQLLDLEFEATRARLRARLDGSLSGNLKLGDTELGHFELDLEGWTSELLLEGEFGDLELASLPIPIDLDWDGKAAGRVVARLAGGKALVSLDMGVETFRLRHPDLHGPIAPSDLRLGLDLSWDGEDLVLLTRSLELDNLRATGQVRVDTAPGGRVVGSLVLEPFHPGQPSRGRLHPISLVGLRHKSWDEIDQKIEAGVIDDIEISLDLALSDLGTAIAFRRKLEPEELQVAGTLREGVFRPSPNDSVLEDISASFALAGNVLEIKDLRIVSEGEPLPGINLVIDGMHRLAHLPPDEREIPKGPGESIDGLVAGARALRSSEEYDYPPLEVKFQNFQIGYTPFLLPIRNASGTLEFPDGKLLVKSETAVVGGAPAQVSAVYDLEPDIITARLTYGDGEAPPALPKRPFWAWGDFSIDTLFLGLWQIDQFKARLEASGSHVEIPEMEGFYAGGPASGRGWVDLSQEDAAVFEFHAKVRDADGARLVIPLERVEGSISGKLAMDGLFRGRLAEELLFIENSEMGMSVLLQDGTLGDLPALVVVARLPSLQGVRGLFGQDLRFEALSTDIYVSNGVLRADHFALRGPELRLHARGEMYLAHEPVDGDFELAFLFLNTVDRVIASVPLLGSWVLGEDESLVTLYVRVDGPWEDPRVRPLPPGAVLTVGGWAVQVVESGVKEIRKMLGGKKANGSSNGQDP